MIRELRFFSGKDKLIFLASVFFGITRILRDRTILTMKFIRPVKIKTDDDLQVKVSYFYEIPFYAYNYDSILDNILSESVLIDIGAHFGEVSYRFLKRKKGYAYLFEPNPNNQEVIMKNFAQMENFSLFPFALGDSNQKQILSLSNPLSYEGSIKHGSGKKIKIIVKKLDDIDMPQLSKFNNVFFKIDVEGYEVETIKGMKELLKKLKTKKVKLFVEIKNNQNLKKIISLLEGIWKKLKVRKVTAEDYLFTN